MPQSEFEGTICITIKGVGDHEARFGSIWIEADGLGAARIETSDVTEEEMAKLGQALIQAATS